MIWLGQLLGLVTFGLGIACFYQRDDRKLKLTMLAMNLNNVPHFWLLGAETAALGSALSVLRTGLALRFRGLPWALGFMAITLGLGAPLVQSSYHWLALVGSCIGSYALFCLQDIAMRVAFLLGALFWLGNNIVAGSIGGILLELTLISVNLRTIFLMRNTTRPQPSSTRLEETGQRF